MTELTKRMCTLLKWERQAMCDGRKRAWKAFRHERAQLTAKASRIEIDATTAGSMHWNLPVHRQRDEGMMAADNDNDPWTFAKFLGKLADGELELDLEARLCECVRSLQDVEGKATATLTLQVKLQADGKGTVDVIPVITTKLPKKPTSRTVTWIDRKTGVLLTENPKQKALPFRAVAGSPKMREPKESE